MGISVSSEIIAPVKPVPGFILVDKDKGPVYPKLYSNANHPYRYHTETLYPKTFINLFSFL